MKVDNTKSKIRKIYNQEISNENKIDIIDRDTTTLENSIKNVDYPINIKNKIRDFSTDWIDLDAYTIERWNTNTYAMHKEFRIELPDMPMKFLPFINVQPIYRCGDNYKLIWDVDGVPFILQTRKNHFFQVGSIDNNIAKNIKLIMGFSIVHDYSEFTALGQAYNPFTIQVKFLVKISNPEF